MNVADAASVTALSSPKTAEQITRTRRPKTPSSRISPTLMTADWDAGSVRHGFAGSFAHWVIPDLWVENGMQSGERFG